MRPNPRHAALAFALVALVACNKAKPRDLPPDPFAAGPPPIAADTPPGEAISAGLDKRPEVAGFFLDHVGQATDPFNRHPAVTAAVQPTVMDGFAFDPVAKAPARGVDLIVDGKAYGTAYGAARPDVADYFKVPALANVGFRTVLPAAALQPGAHTVVVRVVAADRLSYFDSPILAFQAR
jgi:hypothetical protein